VALALGLRHQHTVERVVVKERQMTNGEGVVDADWERSKSLFKQ